MRPFHEEQLLKETLAIALLTGSTLMLLRASTGNV